MTEAQSETQAGTKRAPARAPGVKARAYRFGPETLGDIAVALAHHRLHDPSDDETALMRRLIRAEADRIRKSQAKAAEKNLGKKT
jgi:hypothetical protein